MNLDELYYRENLNRRGYNVCRGNRLLDLEALIKYYHIHGSFLSLRNCGASTNIQLITICKKYIKLDEIGISAHHTENPTFVTVEELNRTHKYKKTGFSNRTLMICKLNNLNSLNDILEHFATFRTYSNLNKTGKATTAELVSIFNKYQAKPQKAAEPERPEGKLLPSIERSTINSFIQLGISQLSIRSENGIKGYLNNDLDYINFQKRILMNPTFDAFSIKNVGAKSVKEIQNFIALVIAYAQEATNLESDEEKQYLRNRITLQRHFSPHRISEDILGSNSILSIVDYLVRHHAVFNGTSGLVLEKCFNIYNDKAALSLDSIAADLGLTRERVRQMRIEVLNKLFKEFEFIKEIHDPFIESLNINNSSSFIWFDQEFVDRVNNESGTQFSREFLTVLFGILNSSHFSFIGVLSDVLITNEISHRTRHNWQGIYLVNREFADAIDFIGIADNLKSQTSQRIEKNIKLDYYSFLKIYVKAAEKDFFEYAAALIEKIIHSEFEAVSISDGFITLHKNTVKLAYEYAYEALIELGKSSYIDDIVQKAIEMNPGYVTSSDKLRASMKRRHGFLPIGRSGKFGLKKWEKEIDEFKGGTIREMVLEYLETHSEPVAMSKIIDYVLKYRPRSNAKSIYSNLHLDPSGNFIFYEKSKLGLSSKVYASHFKATALKEEQSPKSWQDRCRDLYDFVGAVKRLPYSASVPDEEKSLYRWWRAQYKKLKNNQLSEQRAVKILWIVNKYYSEGTPSGSKSHLNNSDYKNSKRSEDIRGSQMDLFD